MRSLVEVRVLPHCTCSKINLSAWGKVRLVGGRWCAGKEWTKRWGFEDEEISGFGMNCFPTMSLTVSRSYLLPICAPHTSNKLSARSSSEPWHFGGYWSLEPATGSYWEQISIPLFDNYPFPNIPIQFVLEKNWPNFRTPSTPTFSPQPLLPLSFITLHKTSQSLCCFNYQSQPLWSTESITNHTHCHSPS